MKFRFNVSPFPGRVISDVLHETATRRYLVEISRQQMDRRCRIVGYDFSGVRHDDIDVWSFHLICSFYWTRVAFMFVNEPRLSE